MQGKSLYLILDRVKMPVVKGGVWTNIEDEILKASVSKYGLNQWARVSSLLARKTPKQCKARWSEWLDPGIRKIEWSKEEDEKLLHLAKLMPTQWRTIAPIVGRTATQCLERYQKLLDEAEAKESDDLGLGGPTGGETLAPSADDVRKLRPGELDPDPESKPARPDTIDLDEDEKEMLSEARARLANTQGKKAKRKARERQLEDSRRMALLQKRRELKNAGINIKITNRKKGQMDYNADIPFEKKATAGFYDTQDELERNEMQREAFDPRKQQLANKRKKDQQQDEPDSKRRKGEQDKPSASYAAATKAGQMQRIREAEQSSKRRALNLPVPQVGEAELEDIVKMGVAGEQANKAAAESDNQATKGFVSDYNSIIGSTPIRTPRAPPQEDHIANEIRNIRALTETQSSLLGGENTPLHEGSATTGFEGVAPQRHVVSTPNPMATPMRNAVPNGLSATPVPSKGGPAMTPMRTPRDKLAVNRGGMSVSSYSTDAIHESGNNRMLNLKSQLAALPQPRALDFELEVPEEKREVEGNEALAEEDAAERDRKREAALQATKLAEFRRRTQVMQRDLPRPAKIDVDALSAAALKIPDPIDSMIAKEKVLLISNDNAQYPMPGGHIALKSNPLPDIDEGALALAKLEIAKEIELGKDIRKDNFKEWSEQLESNASLLPGLEGYQEDELNESQGLTLAFERVQPQVLKFAEDGSALESKLSLHLGGYQKRARLLRQKMVEAAEASGEEARKLDTFRNLQTAEEAALIRRIEALREEVKLVRTREAEGQARYQEARATMVNGAHP